MRPLDLYTEKQMRDGRPDQIASSRAMLRESNGLSLACMLQNKDSTLAGKDTRPLSVQQKELAMDQRDKMTLASVAFCSPLMLLCMGSTLAMFDDFKTSQQSKFELSMKNRLQMREGKLVVDERKNDRIKPNLRQLDQAFEQKLNLEPKTKKKEGQERPALEPKRWLQQGDRSWEKTNKLLKQKQAILDDLQRFRGNLPLSVVSALMATVEKLDKELAKLGC